MSETNQESITLTISNGWMPDLEPMARLNAGGLEVCENCIPTDDGMYAAITNYRLAFSAPYVSAGMPGASFIDSNGRNAFVAEASYSSTASPFIFAVSNNLHGTPSMSIAKPLATGLNVSAAGVSYVACRRADIVSYGTWRIAIGPYFNQPVVASSSGYADTELRVFALSSGAPRQAACGALVAGHVLMGNFVATAANEGKRIIWSAYEDPTDWTPSLITGAGEITLSESNGAIVAIRPLGEMLAVIFTDSIALGQYVGGIWTFDFKQNVHNVGCPYPNAIAEVDGAIFFPSHSTIYKLNRDGSLEDILQGSGINGTRIFNSLVGMIGTSYAEGGVIGDLTVAIEPAKHLIAWFLPTSYITSITSSYMASNNTVLLYNYRSKKFSTIAFPSGVYPVAVQTVSHSMTTENARQVQRIALLSCSSTGTGAKAEFRVLDTPPYYYQVGTYSASGCYSSANGLTARLKVGALGKNDQHITLMRAALEQVSSSSVSTADQVLRVYVQSAYAASATTASASISTATKSYDIQQTGRFISLEFIMTNFSAVGPTLTMDIAKTGGSR